MSDRCILAVKFTLAGAPPVLRKAVGGFLRYVQYRDQHVDSERPAKWTHVEGVLKYVAHRDAAASRGRLFGPAGAAGDEARRALAAYIGRSVGSTRPVVGRDRDGHPFDRRRAAYRFVISPERAAGLDLQALTSRAVSQLESDLNGPVRWIAAEHRNTRHPHVHVVVAGIRELPGGGLESWLLSGRRLEHMKDALALEIERQRGKTRLDGSLTLPIEPTPSPAPDQPLRLARRHRTEVASMPAGGRLVPKARGQAREKVSWLFSWSGPRRSLGGRRSPYATGSMLRGLAARYSRDLQRQAEEERRSREWEGRERG